MSAAKMEHRHQPGLQSFRWMDLQSCCASCRDFVGSDSSLPEFCRYLPELLLKRCCGPLNSVAPEFISRGRDLWIWVKIYLWYRKMSKKMSIMSGLMMSDELKPKMNKPRAQTLMTVKGQTIPKPHCRWRTGWWSGSGGGGTIVDDCLITYALNKYLPLQNRRLQK